jgi:hypothetical protein
VKGIISQDLRERIPSQYYNNISGQVKKCNIVIVPRGSKMTTLKDLNKLAKECGECALGDNRSIDKHLNECGTCSDYMKKAEMFNNALKEIRIIAMKSDDERHRELHERMSRMANMDEDSRNRAISDLLDATSILAEEERLKIVGTRTDILTNFQKQERDPIMESMLSVMSEWDKQRKSAEMRTLLKATDKYPVLKKMMIKNMFEKALIS